jgi:hypothetical protein
MFPRSISFSVAAPALRSSLPDQLQGFAFVSIWLLFVFQLCVDCCRVKPVLFLSRQIKRLEVF